MKSDSKAAFLDLTDASGIREDKIFETDRLLKIEKDCKD